MAVTRKNKTRNRLKWNKILESLDMLHCWECGYDRYRQVLHFHHLHDKIYEMSRLFKEKTPSKRNIEELKKCIPLCANCHLELHIREGFNSRRMDSVVEVRPEDQFTLF